MFKYNVAVPGDKVVITEDQKIFVNDKQLEQFGLPYAYTHFSKSPKDFSGKKYWGLMSIGFSAHVLIVSIRAIGEVFQRIKFLVGFIQFLGRLSLH